jgi:hypothetical protein
VRGLLFYAILPSVNAKPFGRLVQTVSISFHLVYSRGLEFFIHVNAILLISTVAVI